MNRLFYVTGTALLALSATVAAETYRSVDKNGNVTFSDRASRGSEQVKVRVPGQEAATDRGNSDTSAGDTPDGAKSSPGDETNQVRNEKCEQAKQRLTTYQDADTLYEEGDGSSKRMLTSDEQVDAIVNARRMVKDLCGSPPA